MDAAFLEEMWRVNALAGFFFAKAALEAMLPRQRGTLLFTGASRRCAAAPSSAASRRPRRRCARWRSPPRASSARRASTSRTWSSTAPSTATASTASCRGSRRSAAPDGLLDPDAIAENFWQLHCQPRSAWTHEIDVRPWVEPW